MSKLLPRLATLSLLSALCLPASAALDTYLKIPGAPGESVSKDHPKEIEVLSWGWGAATSQSNAGGQSLLLSPLTWTQQLDSAFAPLFMGMVNNTEFDPVKLSVRRTDAQSSVDFFTMTFSNAHMTSLSTSGSGDGVIVSGALVYEGITMSYCPVGAKGNIGTCLSGSFSPTRTGAMAFSGDAQVLRGLAEAGGSLGFAISPVPEPSAAASALAGLIGLGWLVGVGRRRHQGAVR